jgi:2-hydroxy-3-keto-5-methylthiopentenyl-1-phosphate phosphatase
MMDSNKAMKTLVQCDFDGTITEKDVSFLLLDAFSEEDWRPLLAQYQRGEISVNSFNSQAFAMVRKDKQTLLQFARDKAKMREGFRELVDYCRRQGFRFVVVSNGEDFYIEALLRDMGLDDIEIFAAKAEFDSSGVKTRYIGPDGNCLEDGFKEAYVRWFIAEGYSIVYVGNGSSDLSPARLASHVFATGDLLAQCEQKNLNCIPFVDLNDVIRGLERLPRK